ncbi:MAG TPA: hypothetical protein DE045_07770 [Oceanospirillaceae bacterium]|nr:hypothetical protein [Oceanospirillaceae bacterium]
MECETNFWESALPAIAALAGVLVTLVVQGFIERSRRNHESNIGGRVPLTSACEDLFILLEAQMSAITLIEALVNAEEDVSTHDSLRVIAEKTYRKKLWAIIDDQECVQPINKYAEAVEGIAFKLIAGEKNGNLSVEIRDARNHLGTALKNITKHTAEIWGLEVVK